MKAPVCDICRFVPVRCKLCDERFRKGELTSADFEVSQILSKTRSKIELKKAFDIGSYFVGIYSGELSEKDKQKLKKPFLDVNNGKNMLQKLGVSVQVSRAFKNGEEVEKVLIPKAQLESKGIDEQLLKKALEYFKLETTIA